MYETVYDVREAIPWGDFQFVGFGLLMLAVGCWMWLVAADRVPQPLVQALEKLPRRKPVSKPALKTSSYVVTAFGLLWVLVTGTGIVGGWLTYRAALDSGEHERVEGIVENFEPARRGGNSREQFSVDSVHFSYSSFSISPAFKATQPQGGPIREGLPVRISYVPRDKNNAIVRLEVRTNELEAVAQDESTPRPMLPVGLVAPLMLALAIVVGWLLFFTRDPRLKRRLFPVLLILGTLLLVAFGLDSGSSPGAVLLLVPIMLFNLWMIRFCDACGATVVPQGSWKRPTTCNHCGQPLGSS